MASTPRNCLFFFILLVMGSQESFFFLNLPMLPSLYFFPGGNASVWRTSCSLENNVVYHSGVVLLQALDSEHNTCCSVSSFRKKVSTFCPHITAASCPEEMSLAYPSAQMGTRPVWLGSLFDFLLDFSCVLSCFFHVCNAQPSPLSIHCACNHVNGGRALN